MSEVIGSDWRNLARQLGIEEYDIMRIHTKAIDQHSAAKEVVFLYLYFIKLLIKDLVFRC